MKIIVTILASFLVLLSFESCYYDKAELLYPDGKVPCDTTTVMKFSTDVLPLMNTHCNSSGCHNTASASSGVILDTYNGVKTQAVNGRLMGSTGVNGSMPKGAAKLPSCTLAGIQRWIDSGTPNN
ncbi:MAG TPA: hypothetical protein PLZ45_00400 [Ferruginibacter sp.]|nr:hypothetical protein [Ferruginibacter sp.]